MPVPSTPLPRRAAVDDAPDVAALLHEFNTEFTTPTPGPGVLLDRLRRLLAGDATFAILAGSPAVAVALVTLRSNVWFDGPVALLDEMYVEPEHRGRGIGAAVLERAVSTSLDLGAQLMEIQVDEEDVGARRFYERHGFAGTDPDTGEPALYYSRDLAG